MCSTAKKKFDVHRIAVMHILGDCPVGMASVIIAASSPHRKDAIKCVELMIDELKASVPIWKCEVYDGDDGAIWKENVEWSDGRKKRVMIRKENDFNGQKEAVDEKTSDKRGCDGINDF
mmetsp:Transcript_17252/g.17437  ORF Transcript_17252/g.17437 Transcript_17252/m.17437 type:complete len:119 (-) Transcript_17252:450-806(-)|eukprot:CAMPEP_0171298012 /NCGR_PEP_ID=MMETSP0816-20121228/6777_1 /TAXON_ID=420281 /ORGANISM="Proboscia inermis, Strain CCAP1064/1" /LENGTH=118 /DNA_ID=CAMNT_0011772745 /DNA_START=379 /DNA_END=735 /DNA_ORIENTATION=+